MKMDATKTEMIAIGTKVRWYSLPDRETVFGIVRDHFTASTPFTWHKVEVTVGSRFAGGIKSGESRCVPRHLLDVA